MSELHEFYLGLGSNIEPEANLRLAIGRLKEHGEILALSSVWESRAVGSEGPNFLNLCAHFAAEEREEGLKSSVLRPIEASMGRLRTGDKNAPRTIDIDILVVDGKAVNPNRWSNAFVIVPLAELLPDFEHPLDGKRMAQAATAAREQTWIVRRLGARELLAPPASR